MSSIKKSFYEFFRDFESFLQQELNRTLMSNKWDENTITQKIAEKFVNDWHSLEILNLDPTPAKIKSLAYRQSGKHETSSGDLAFWVKIQYPDSTILEGVGFLEAKRTYLEKSEKSINLFNEIKLEQLDRIYKYAPHSFLLLYDHQPIDTKIFNYFYNLDIFSSYLRLNKNLSFPTCTVVPINIALEINKKTRELYKFGELFSIQVVSRFLLGKDLHFSQQIKDIFRQYQTELSELRTKYLIVSSVAYGDSEPSPETVDINREIYRQIEIS